MATLFAASIGAGPLLAAEDAQVPKRKPGLWEIVTVASVTGMTKIKVCVGEDDDLVTLSQGDCSKPEVTLLNEGLIVDLVCTSEQGTQSISTAFTGDFNTRYHATLKTNFDPPVGGIPHMGVKLDGKCLGPDCPPEAAPPAEQ
ncbi:MAG TPA: DUF3617 family protein [Methyloceanibacter sp.]|jgi:Protein of unknown function (DUF3617)|nr:DUF3617 family protein [Methyloceanibacter sp.]